MSVRVCRLTEIGVLSFHVATLAGPVWWARFLMDRWGERCWVEADWTTALRSPLKLEAGP